MKRNNGQARGKKWIQELISLFTLSPPFLSTELVAFVRSLDPEPALPAPAVLHVFLAEAGTASTARNVALLRAKFASTRDNRVLLPYAKLVEGRRVVWMKSAVMSPVRLVPLPALLVLSSSASPVGINSATMVRNAATIAVEESVPVPEFPVTKILACSAEASPVPKELRVTTMSARSLSHCPVPRKGVTKVQQRLAAAETPLRFS